MPSQGRNICCHFKLGDLPAEAIRQAVFEHALLIGYSPCLMRPEKGDLPILELSMPEVHYWSLTEHLRERGLGELCRS